ncbi:MAG: hypothetical protein AW09_004436 [Candidatus Accumulibacter phosphatis]|uniref:Uncharacterized protein n=1 Tax=Candidatus Accumulibacter phosphatis TaxID=327160 RepID=A0A084Y6X3_9PROT|nr:MAG: hypothetical protein AW09_004436 [Candidatus Accumulibacter phosphatis]
MRPQGFDLVEEQRPAFRLGHHPAARLSGIGESAPDVPEQLAFDQIVGDGATVDRNERCAAARPRIVDGTRRQFLASSGLALDEYRRIASGKLGDVLQHLAEHRGFPYKNRGSISIFKPHLAPPLVALSGIVGRRSPCPSDCRQDIISGSSPPSPV